MEKRYYFKRAACIALSAAVLFGASSCKKKTDESSDNTANSTSSSSVISEQTTQKTHDGKLNPLTGLYEKDFNAEGKRPFAVVVENSPAARPQWGISTPDILTEGLAEGGITRMLLLYADVGQIPKIGPLRSARHDFVEVAECFDAIFVHAGWSKYAKSKIKSDNVDNVNGIEGYKVPFFFRDSSRKSRGIEHSGYSDGEHISATADYLKYRRDVKSGYENVLTFNSEDEILKPAFADCGTVSFSFSSQNKHSLKFNSEKDAYFDSLNGSARVDADGVQLNYKNILVLKCSVKLMGDSVGCVDMGLENQNTGYYASHGGYEKISWTRSGSGLNSKLVINDSQGQTLSMNAGNTYIAIVPTSQESTISFS
ncbi:MAG: DUF3048 domain-containing protein [Clostridia bacterium]|nr:DUF3048 domain-containing protein [Clostridia bacterium]